MRATTFLCLFFSVTLSCYAQANNLTFTVEDVNKNPLAGVQVIINNQHLASSNNGKVTFKATKDRVYSVSFNKSGYYPRVHTFTTKELQRYASHGMAFQLVKKKAKRTLFAFAGDVMMGRRYYKPYFDDEVLINAGRELADSKALLAHVKPYLSIADIAAVNLESQIAEQKPTHRAPKSVTFYSKPHIVEALKWAGIDYVTLGNNHTYDYLDEGLTSTLLALNQADMPYSGAGLNQADALAPYKMRHNNNNYALLGYVGWQGSSIPKQTATHEHGGAAYGSMENILTGVKRAKQNTHIPIVQYHGSLEYKKEPTGVTEQRLKSAIDHGAALAIAHHPHVTQGIELYNNQLIAYSMGNFIFDQNFSATQHSFILYVWLDDEQFYRAEIAPVYVKGYKPTPAIGTERNTVLKRLQHLSAKRNTHITDHMGHGVISRKNSPTILPESRLELNAKTEKVHPLTDFPWSSLVNKVTMGNHSQLYRLGSNLINGSDFEHFSHFNAVERGFMYNKRTSAVVNTGYNSQRSMQLSVSVEPQWFGMKHFRRVYKPSNPVTFKTHIKTEAGVKLTLYWQGRKTRQKLFDAFENSPKYPIKTIELTGKKQWQPIEIDFNSPRIGYRSYRILLEIESKSGANTTLNLDNFSVIEWQTAFQHNKTPFYLDEDSKMANFIGFDRHSTQPIAISLQ